MRHSTMTASLATFALIVTPLAVAQDATEEKAGEAYELKLKFAKGEHKYKMRTSMAQSGGMQFKIKGELFVTETIGETDAETGLGNITQKRTRVKVEADMGMGKQNFDTDNPDGGDQNPMFAGMAKGMLVEAKLKVKSNGKVEKSETDKPDAAAAQSMGTAQYPPYDLIVLPEKAVKVGDTWTHEINQKNPGGDKEVKSTITYKLKRVADRKGNMIATIDFTMKLDLPATNQMGMEATVKKSEGKGTASLDITEGRIRSCNYAIKIVTELDMGEGNTMEQNQKLTFSMRTDSKAEAASEEKEEKSEEKEEKKEEKKEDF